MRKSNFLACESKLLGLLRLGQYWDTANQLAERSAFFKRRSPTLAATAASNLLVYVLGEGDVVLMTRLD